jgi:phosphate acyltransferase
MRVKILSVRIMLSNLNSAPLAPIAEAHASRIECVLPVVTTTIDRSSRRKRKNKLRVAVDLMGGNSPPIEIFKAVLELSKEIHREDILIVLAQHAVLPALRSSFHNLPSSIEFITTEEAIEMEDAPLFAVRRKKDSSMAAGMRLLKEKKVDAFVSSGNTGALVASAKLYLPMLPSIERPALLVTMPTEKGKVAVLDVGANIAPKAHHLASYALLGTLFRHCMFGEQNPTVGLLNIGVEEQKGTEELKEAYRLLKQTFKDRFLGNIEGREVFQGKIDVLVTDGFTGNVFLKTSEGISTFLAEYLQHHFTIPETIAHLHQRFDYSEHPGALLCGVDGLIIKCHGFSDKRALMNGIRGAFTLANANLLSQLKHLLQ